MTVEPQTGSQPQASRWDSLIWPRWVPIRARLPLLAQITGAFALIAAVAMPPFSEVPAASPASPAEVAPPPNAAPQPDVAPPPAETPPSAVAPPPPEVQIPSRPAHLNLEVLHSFKTLELSVSVDGKRMLETELTGSGKRFGVFGKRGERAFTRSVEFDPGVRVVHVRLRADDDKFDQTRVERFDLGSAAVAAMRITANKSGLVVTADRPPPPKQPVVAKIAPAAPRQMVPAVPVVRPAERPLRPAAPLPSALAELYNSLRKILITVAGFVASAAAGFFVQEFLKARKKLVGL